MHIANNFSGKRCASALQTGRGGRICTYNLQVPDNVASAALAGKVVRYIYILTLYY